MEDARDKAHQEPIRLSKHWPMAVCIFSCWVALLLWCVHLLVQRYGDEDLVEYEWAVLAGERSAKQLSGVGRSVLWRCLTAAAHPFVTVHAAALLQQHLLHVDR